MKKKMFITISLFLILISYGCEELNDIGEIDIRQSVFIDLSVNREQQEYYIYETLSINDPLGGYPFGSNDNFFVDDAVITLIDENGNSFSQFSLAFRDSSSVTYKYITNMVPLDIQEDSKYKVIIKSGDETISGEVNTLKKITGFSASLLETNVEELNGIAVWDDIEEAKYYILKTTYFFSGHPLDGSGMVPIYTEILTKQDEYKQEFHNFNNQYWDSLRVRVIACDENIYKHFIEENDQVNITNAYGYLASTSIADTVFVLKK